MKPKMKKKIESNYDKEINQKKKIKHYVYLNLF